MVLYYSLGMLTRNEMKGVHSGMWTVAVVLMQGVLVQGTGSPVFSLVISYICFASFLLKTSISLDYETLSITPYISNDIYNRFKKIPVVFLS